MTKLGIQEMVHTFANTFQKMTSDNDKRLFEDTILIDMARRGNAILNCAALLFAGFVDQATQVAQSCGGGGNTSDLPWRRDKDEDDLDWARRCLLRAQKMTRPIQRRQSRRR